MERLLENQVIPLVTVEKERLNTFLTKLLRMRWSVALPPFFIALPPFFIAFATLFYRNDFNFTLLSGLYQLKHHHLCSVSLYVYMV